MGYEKLQKFIGESCEKFCSDLPSQPANLYDPIRYAITQGGKRVRPLLSLIAADLFGGDVKKALPSALAVELFHNFSLLHDDIMDNAPMRRGEPSVHVKWNHNIAILSGDALFTESFRCLAKSDADVLPELLNIFTRTALEVCEGQQLDMDFESRTDVGIPEYMRMIELKTAVLLGAALQMGAVAVRASAKDASALYEFGKHTGIAFQLQDDILDTFGDAGKFGKRKGGDIVANKKTFLLLKAFERSSRYQKEELLNWIQVKNEQEKIDGITALFETLNVRKSAEDEMQLHYQQAKDALKSIGADTGALVAFADALIDREY